MVRPFGQRDHLRAVGAIGDASAEALNDREHLVEVGDGDAADGQELHAVGLEDHAPRLGLVNAVEAFALGEHGEHALEHLARFGAIGQAAEEVDVVDEVVVAGEPDDGDGLDFTRREPARWRGASSTRGLRRVRVPGSTWRPRRARQAGPNGGERKNGSREVLRNGG